VTFPVCLGFNFLSNFVKIDKRPVTAVQKCCKLCRSMLNSVSERREKGQEPTYPQLDCEPDGAKVVSWSQSQFPEEENLCQRNFPGHSTCQLTVRQWLRFGVIRTCALCWGMRTSLEVCWRCESNVSFLHFQPWWFSLVSVTLQSSAYKVKVWKFQK
jgi:hypothetical protein